MNYCSVFLDPPLLTRVQIQGRLNCGSQPALIAFLECNEPEWLLGCGNRTQHLCCALDWPRVSQEHQLDARAPTQHARHAEQATGERNGLQLAGREVSVRQSKDSRRDIGKPCARAAVIRVRLGEKSHVSSRVWYVLAKSRRLRKDGHSASYPKHSLNLIGGQRVRRFQ